MLHRITSFAGVNGRKLMDLYREGNLENAAYFHPDAPDKALALQEQEEDFLRFIQTDFFQKKGNEYWVLEEENTWVSALRLYQISEERYYIEALETHPEFRRRGYAEHLLNSVTEELKRRGPFQLWDCVGKRNEASIRTHLKCGFEIAAQSGFDYLTDEVNDQCFGMRYSNL